MPLVSGIVDVKDYPSGMLAMLVRTKNSTRWDGINGPDVATTFWDAGATTFDDPPILWDAVPGDFIGLTTWDTAHTKWDAGKLGARRVAFNNQPTPTYSASWINGTTWDAGATTWDGATGTWDRTPGPLIPDNAYSATLAASTQYGQKWEALAPWKRSRWIACARARHLSGHALYRQCAFQQQTPLDKQPISPCSRRATDPNASPFDWTP